MSKAHSEANKRRHAERSADTRKRMMSRVANARWDKATPKQRRQQAEKMLAGRRAKVSEIN